MTVKALVRGLTLEGDGIKGDGGVALGLGHGRPDGELTHRARNGHIDAVDAHLGKAEIGGGAVVVKDVPPNSTVVGVPAKVVRQDGKKVEYKPLDQINILDPVQQQLDRLEQQIKDLESKLSQNK